MPMPTRNAGEDRDAFIGRCMADDAMTADFPDAEQRMAVCRRQADESARAEGSAADAPVVASAPSAAPLAIEATATVEIEAAAKADDGTPRRPRFNILGYTGGVLKVAGFNSPVIVDLDGLRASGDVIPALRNHDHDRIVGQADGIAIDGSGVRLSGTITGDDDDPDIRKITGHARNGFRWKASIGAKVDRQEFLKPGARATVNGRDVTGPLVIAREATLQEISFVSIGADSQTAASVAASHPSASPSGAPTMFEQWLQAKGFDPAAISDVQRSSLEALYNAEQSAAKAGKGGNDGNARADGPADGVKAEGLKSLDDEFAAIKARQESHDAIRAMAKDFCLERPSLMDDIKALATAAIEGGSSVSEFELAARRTMGTIQHPGIIVKGGNRLKADTRVIEAAVCQAGGLDDLDKRFDDQTLNAAYDHFPNGLGLRDLFATAARENGHAGYISSTNVRELLEAAFGGDGVIRAAGFSTFSLPNILSSVANKFLRAGFEAVESTWRQVAARRSVRDFKAVSSYSLTGDFKYEKVGPSGEIKHATAGELEYTNQAETYARMFAITRRDLVNDDLGALTAVPRRLGRGAALKLNEVFWTTFLDNSAFFTSARGNYAEGADTALGIDALTAGEALFFDMTDPDGNPVAVNPTILLVPNALFVAATTLMNSTEVRDTTANTVATTANPHAGKFRVVRSAYLSNSSYTGYSTTAWYLLSDPDDLPVIEVAFLNGRETPMVESADADFNTLGVQFRGVSDWGVALQEYRGGVKIKGAA